MQMCKTTISYFLSPVELVIEKQDLSEEEKLPDIIDISNEKSKTESKDLWAIHEKDLKVA